MYKYKNKDVFRIYRGGYLLYERYTEIIEPMLVTPSDFNISISSASDLEIDWGDGTVQTVKSGDDTTFDIYGLIINKYTHTYTDSYVDKIISVKHLDGGSPIQFFKSDAIKTVQRWYSEGYQPINLSYEAIGLNRDMTFYGLGSQLETVPNIAPPKTTDLSGMFSNALAFNQDLSLWDVSGVSSMYGMFSFATAFDQDISMWDVSGVIDMYGMFQNATTFNQPLNSWNVSNVTNMSGMFNYAEAFNQDIGSWNVFNVTDMGIMFFGASVFNQDISVWDVSNVTDMSQMFRDTAEFNQDISGWDVSNVVDMTRMFQEAISFNQDLSGWCVTSITSEPSNFSIDSPLTSEHKPVWGTCPRGENLLTT